MSTAIRVRNLIKTYPGKPPVQAVQGIDLDVTAGECFGLLGPNGAGKTTTLEILEGLLDATSGEVEILGKSWSKDEKEIRSLIGISLQETRLPDKLRVSEVVRLFRSFYTSGMTPEAAIDSVSLQEKANSAIEKLSGGQKQRLAVACALVGNPQILFLDEPTTGLDPQSRRQLWDVINAYKKLGRTVMLTTHYMDEAERLCDRVAIVDHGKVIALGTPPELIRKIGGEHVIEFGVNSEQEADVGKLQLEQIPGVIHAREAGGRTSLTVSEPHQTLPRLLSKLSENHMQLTSLSTHTATLEDVFVTLTGRTLRDDQA